MLIGEDVVEGRRFASVDPSNPTIIVAHAHGATAEHVRDAITRAEHGQKVWSQALRRRARRRALARRRHPALPPARAHRAGRPRGAASRGPRPTATSARRSTSSSTTRTARSRWTTRKPLIQLPGERNAMRYVPRGVTGVIAPWNFPLAIAAGMVSAALATGNAVVLKPAEQAPACAKAVVDALHAGGVPLDALLAAPRRRRAGQGAGRRPAHPHARLHRLLRRRPEHPRDRREGRARPAAHQARDRRDGRQERGHRRLRRRPRRRRAGAAEVGLRVRGAEVQRRLAARWSIAPSPTSSPSDWQAP